MNTPYRRRLLYAATAMLLAATAACGSSGSSDEDVRKNRDDDRTEESRAPAPATEPSDAPVSTEPHHEPVGTTVQQQDGAAGAVSDLQDVRGAVVQIEAVGTFVDPEFGAVEGAGRGSGFVIDPSGIAVTNNHVVTGAGLLHVSVEGEDEPRNARVLGVSECSDLAVIQIDGPELPYLEWADGAEVPGTEVYLAGFPLGDPEYTLTRGVVAKADAGGDSSWSSIDHTLEHDANSQPGNSGGPLVSADGQVVGVHYASSSRTNTSQPLAIAGDIARPIVDELASGVDVHAVGINGQVVQSEDGSVSGLWVAGVASGSPADEIGLAPGDIVTRIEGVSVGLDGTMRDYCDVLRSHAPGDQLAIEVLRFDTEEVLEGELNGDVLAPAFSFEEELDEPADEPDDEPGDPADGPTYANYVSLVDDTNTITVAVPDTWTDVSGAPIDIGDGQPSPAIVAATDIAGFTDTWETPGVQFIASSALAQLTADEMLDLLPQQACTSTGREPYEDAYFTGLYEVHEACGDTATRYVQVAAVSADGAYGVLVAVQVVTDADLEALDVILTSFNVVM